MLVHVLHTTKEEQFMTDAAIDSLNDKLATLMEVAALVNSNHDLDHVVSHTVVSACRLTGAETGSLRVDGVKVR